MLRVDSAAPICAFRLARFGPVAVLSGPKFDITQRQLHYPARPDLRSAPHASLVFQSKLLPSRWRETNGIVGTSTVDIADQEPDRDRETRLSPTTSSTNKRHLFGSSSARRHRRTGFSILITHPTWIHIKRERMPVHRHEAERMGQGNIAGFVLVSVSCSIRMRRQKRCEFLVMRVHNIYPALPLKDGFPSCRN